MTSPSEPADHHTFSTNTVSSGTPVPTPEPRRRRTPIVLAIVLAAGLAGLGGGLVGAASHQDAAPV
ncbi:MAG: hypothetical protein MUQ27_12730, partial [Acidimicrobiia bacterium]|nr:hypothetical protein [Acidimicrobiia bacterium]